MNLDFDSIKEAIEKEFAVISQNKVSEGRLYGCPMFYDSTEPTDGGIVLIDASNDPVNVSKMSAPLLLISIGPPPVTLPLTTAYLELSADAGVMAVMNCLQKLFRRFENICSRLNRIYTTGKGVQALMDAMLPVFENPVYVHDKNYRMFAYAENRENPDEDWTYDFYYGGSLSPETIQRLTRSPRFAETFKTTYPTYYVKEAAIEDYNYLYINLRKKGRYCGRLFVDEKVRPIEAFDYPCLDILAHYIELILAQGKASTNPQSRLLPTRLVQLSEGRQLDTQAMDEIRRELNWQDNYRFSCIQMLIDNDDDYQNIGLSLCELINAKAADCFAFPYKQGVLLLVNQKPNSGDVIEKWIRPLAVNFNLKVGISRTASELRQLSLCVRQTELALSTIAEGESASKIEYYDDHLLDYLLDNTLNKIPASMLCPASLLRLIDYDRVNKTDYTNTLKAYLECDLSPTKASDKLYIHRSSFLYRLDKISEITKEDFHLNDTQILYRLMFHLMEKNPTIL